MVNTLFHPCEHLVRHLAPLFCRYTCPEGPWGYFFIFLHQGSSGHQGACTDVGPTEDRGTHPDECIVLHNAAVDNGLMTDGDVRTYDAGTVTGFHMQDGSVLDIGTGTDPDLVKVDEIEGYEVVEVPAMKTADEMGMRLVSNMVMLGAFVKKSGLFPIEVLEKTLAEFVSEKFLQADIAAVRAGADLV